MVVGWTIEICLVKVALVSENLSNTALNTTLSTNCTYVDCFFKDGCSDGG